MRITPSVLTPWKINPLGMPELIAHEIQVGSAIECTGRQANHLVQGNRPLNCLPVLVRGHALINRRVRQLEEEGLPANQGLVMGLHITDDTLLSTPIRQFVEDSPHWPVLVLHLFGQVKPEIGHTHRHAIVEPNTAIRHRRSAPRHPRHVLGNRYRPGMRLVNHAIRHLEIGPGIVVHRAVKIHSVVRERLAQPMIPEEHGRHAIKPEAVKMVLVKPKAAIRQEKVQDIRLPVVEASAIPGRMPALHPRMKVLVVRPVEERQTVALVLDGMGMDKVHNDPQPHSMRRINQGLQVVRRAKPRRCRVKRTHMVTEAPVVRMLHNAHELNRIVSGLLDSRQDIVPKVRIGSHARFLGRHADMGLIDERRKASANALWGFVLPAVLPLRLPDPCTEEIGRMILHDIARIGRDALAVPPFPANLKPIIVAVANQVALDAAFPDI